MSKRQIAYSCIEPILLLLFGLNAVTVTAQAATSGAGSSAGHAAPGHPVTVSWEAVSGATAYEVLIRPLGGDVVIDRHTDKTSITESLQPGTYQVRVVTFNIFHKAASESAWRNLDVVMVLQPNVTRVVPSILYSGLSAQSLTITGSDFLPETLAELARDGKPVASAAVEKVMDDQLEVQVNLANVAPGHYDLLLTNPDNLTVVAHDAIDVLPRVQPHIDGMSLSAAYNDRVYRDVTVTGSGFSSSTSFFLQSSDNRIDIATAIVPSATAARMDIDLGSVLPGKYALVSANPGGLTATLPNALSVDNITYPRFETMDPSTFTIGRSNGTFILRATEMIPQAQVFLKSGATLIPVEAVPNSVEVDSAGQTSDSDAPRSFHIYLSAVQPGTYDLVIRNSRFLLTTVNDLVTIRPKPVPSISSSSITHGYNTKEYPDIVLVGRNLEPRYRVALKFGTTQQELTTRYVSSDRLDVDADFKGLTPGRYELVVQDSGMTVAQLPGGIAVTPPPPPPPPLFVHPLNYTLLLGYAYEFSTSQTFANSVANSKLGGAATGAFPVGIKFFPGVPIVQDTGLALDVGYSYFGSPTPTSTNAVNLSISHVGFDLYYRTPFNFPLNLVLRAGYGIAFSAYQVQSAFGKSTGTSADFYYRFGAAIEVDVGTYVTFETGVGWTRTLYSAASFDNLGLMARAGVRLGR